jgi:hypothetical protein
MSLESPTNHEHNDPYKFFPELEDWDALQGGRPRVFRNPRRAMSRWLVLHVYDEHGEPEKRFQKGQVVETLPPESTKIPWTITPISRIDWEGNKIERDIMVPTFMLLDFHGNPCEQRSGSSRGSRYTTVRNQGQYEDFLNEQISEGMQELQYLVRGGAATILPLDHIRPARELDRPATPEA